MYLIAADLAAAAAVVKETGASFDGSSLVPAELHAV
jgi:hypothetical protein